MTQQVQTDNFDGPFGLLLELVEKNRMPVTQIAIASITSEYLDRIANLGDTSAEAMGEFLQLGSRLVYIKSLALLSTPEPDEQTDELRRLGEELAEYQRYQAVAKVLGTRSNKPMWPRGTGASLPASDRPLPELPLAELGAAFQAALRHLEPVKPRGTIARQLSQAEVIARLKRRLERGNFALDDLLGELRDRLEVVVTFSALLELIREGHSRVTQSSQFAPIMVEAA